MNVVEKRDIDTPFVSIESFGTYWKSSGWDCKEYFEKHFVASLTFTVKTLFRSYEKTIYLPILFPNAEEIKSILEHYDDIYFLIRFKTGYSTTHYSDLYHISNIVDLEKIYKKEYDALEQRPMAHGIDFVVRNYKGYDIVINAQFNSSIDTRCSETDIEFFYSKNNEKNCLKLIEENYLKIARLASYSIKNNQTNTYNSIYNVDKFKNMIEHIDKLNKIEEERKEKLGSMYSKITFKLVEN